MDTIVSISKVKLDGLLQQVQQLITRQKVMGKNVEVLQKENELVVEELHRTRLALEVTNSEKVFLETELETLKAEREVLMTENATLLIENTALKTDIDNVKTEKFSHNEQLVEIMHDNNDYFDISTVSEAALSMLESSRNFGSAKETPFDVSLIISQSLFGTKSESQAHIEESRSELHVADEPSNIANFWVSSSTQKSPTIVDTWMPAPITVNLFGDPPCSDSHSSGVSPIAAKPKKLPDIVDILVPALATSNVFDDASLLKDSKLDVLEHIVEGDLESLFVASSSVKPKKKKVVFSPILQYSDSGFEELPTLNEVKVTPRILRSTTRRIADTQNSKSFKQTQRNQKGNHSHNSRRY